MEKELMTGLIVRLNDNLAIVNQTIEIIKQDCEKLRLEYYKQEPIISTHSQYPITNRELIKSGFEVYYPRDAPGFLFCTDEANEPLFFSAFDRLVKKAGLQVGFDHRNLYLQAKTYKLAHATTSTKRQPVTTILTAASIADVVHS